MGDRSFRHPGLPAELLAGVLLRAADRLQQRDAPGVRQGPGNRPELLEGEGGSRVRRQVRSSPNYHPRTRRARKGRVRRPLQGRDRRPGSVTGNATWSSGPASSRSTATTCGRARRPEASRGLSEQGPDTIRPGVRSEHGRPMPKRGVRNEVSGTRPALDQAPRPGPEGTRTGTDAVSEAPPGRPPRLLVLRGFGRGAHGPQSAHADQNPTVAGEGSLPVPEASEIDPRIGLGDHAAARADPQVARGDHFRTVFSPEDPLSQGPSDLDPHARRGDLTIPPSPGPRPAPGQRGPRRTGPVTAFREEGCLAGCPAGAGAPVRRAPHPPGRCRVSPGTACPRARRPAT